MMSKWINLGYAAALLCSVWALMRRLIDPSCAADILSLPLFYFVNDFFIASQLNNLNTELPAALFLVWVSLSLFLQDNHRIGSGC